MNKFTLLLIIFFKEYCYSRSSPIRFLQFEDLIKNLNEQSTQTANNNNEDFKSMNYSDYQNLLKFNLVNNQEITNDTMLNEYLNVKMNLKNISNVLFFGEWKSNKYVNELNNDRGKMIFRLDLQRYLTFSKEYYYEFFWQIELIRDDFYNDKIKYIKNMNEFFDEFDKISTNQNIFRNNSHLEQSQSQPQVSDQIDIDYEKNIFTQIDDYDAYDQQIFIESYNKNFATKGNINIENLNLSTKLESDNKIHEFNNKYNITDISYINFSQFRTQISKNYMRIPLFAFTTISSMNLLVFKTNLNKGEYIKGNFNLDLLENNILNEYEITFNVHRIIDEHDFYNTPFLKIILLSITFLSLFNSIFLLSYIEKTPSNSRYVS